VGWLEKAHHRHAGRGNCPAQAGRSGFRREGEGSGEITLNAVIVEQGTWKEIHGQTITVPLDEKNIEDLFNRAGQRLGEGLHLDYWQTHYDQDVADEMPSRSRLTLFLALQDEKTWKTLESVCGDRMRWLLKAAQGRHQEADHGGAGGIQQGAGGCERPGGRWPSCHPQKSCCPWTPQTPPIATYARSHVCRRHRAFRRAAEHLGARRRRRRKLRARMWSAGCAMSTQALGAGAALRARW
jgi:hypothetical protein